MCVVCVCECECARACVCVCVMSVSVCTCVCVHCVYECVIGLKRVGKIVLAIEYSAVISHEYWSTHLLGIH